MGGQLLLAALDLLETQTYLWKGKRIEFKRRESGRMKGGQFNER